MTVGVGLFGTITAYVASWFVVKKEEEIEEKKMEEKEMRREEKKTKAEKQELSVVD